MFEKAGADCCMFEALHGVGPMFCPRGALLEICMNPLDKFKQSSGTETSD